MVRFVLGAEYRQLVQGLGHDDRVAAGGHLGIGQQHGELSRRSRSGQLQLGGPERELDIGGAVAPEGKYLGHDRFRRLGLFEFLDGNHPVGEGQDRKLARGPPAADRGGQGGAGQAFSVHRAGPVDQQADGGLGPLPRCRGQFIDGGRSSFGSGRRELLEACVDVDVSGVDRRSGPYQFADPSGSGLAGSCQVKGQPAGQLPGQGGQVGIGGLGHLGQQLQRGVRILGQKVVEFGAVELAQLGRDVGKGFVAVEVPAADRAPSIVGEGLLGVIAGENLVF